MNPSNYEVELDVSVEVLDELMAESEEEAAKWSEEAVRRGIANGLKKELKGGQSSIGVSVESVRKQKSG